MKVMAAQIDLKKLAKLGARKKNAGPAPQPPAFRWPPTIEP